MPRCLVLVNGANYDVTNLMNEEGLHRYRRDLRLLQRRQSEQQLRQRERRPSSNNFDWSVPLYPNLKDPCNKRLLRDLDLPEWKSVPLVKKQSTNNTNVSVSEEAESDKYAEFYELQRRDMERMSQAHAMQQQQHDFSQAADLMTSLPQRAQTAPLNLPQHHHMNMMNAHGNTSAHHQRPSLTSAQSSFGFGSAGMMSASAHVSPTNNNNLATTSRQSLPPVRRPHRHSTTAVPGDIESSSSGLRPRVNYKALYNRNRNLSCGSSSSGSPLRSSISSFCEEEEDPTNSTMMSSSQHLHHLEDAPHLEEDPVQEEEEEDQGTDAAPAAPATMEIAPNVRVAVRSSQETYKAVQSGDYTVATCFACTATIVCVDDAAYVLCPDCQVVSPLSVGGPSHDASKKDDPYGIGTGLKREWVNEWVGSI